jgi:ubiquinone/menaquinone biosynthesis C-methylase UbiE
MEAQLEKKLDVEQEQIREQQKQTWDKFSPGWKKWDDRVITFLKPAGDAIISHLKLRDVDVVLDVATGTGEPGLSIASLVKRGKVVGSDLSAGMLAVARENALKKGLLNFETAECDISNLPYPDASFDAISCRFGFMFFPDMQLAAKEMFRVLKPGGRFATTVWGLPEKNYWATSFLAPIMKNMQIPAPPAGAPGLFRCTNQQQMTDLLKQAGFKNVAHLEINHKAESDSLEVLWTYMNEVIAPVVAAMSKADEAMKAKIKKEVFEGIRQRHPGNGALKLDAQSILYFAEKE